MVDDAKKGMFETVRCSRMNLGLYEMISGLFIPGWNHDSCPRVGRLHYERSNEILSHSQGSFRGEFPSNHVSSVALTFLSRTLFLLPLV